MYSDFKLAKDYRKWEARLRKRYGNDVFEEEINRIKNTPRGRLSTLVNLVLTLQSVEYEEDVEVRHNILIKQIRDMGIGLNKEWDYNDAWK